MTVEIRPWKRTKPTMLQPGMIMKGFWVVGRWVKKLRGDVPRSILEVICPVCDNPWEVTVENFRNSKRCTACVKAKRGRTKGPELSNSYQQHLEYKDKVDRDGLYSEANNRIIEWAKINVKLFGFGTHTKRNRRFLPDEDGAALREHYLG